MEIQVDTSRIQQLEADLNTAGRSLDRKTLGPALMDAAKPMLIAAQQEAPVGRVPKYKSSRITRGRNKGGIRQTGGSFSRGGATRRDIRLRQVDGVGTEVVRVLDGVSKKSGKVGWRTHFIERNFLQAAYNRTIDVVILRFMGSVTKTVSKILERAAR